MVIKTKRKIISGISLLCVIMLLIGIFPTSIFVNNNVDAAEEITYNKNYIYFDISSLVSDETNTYGTAEQWKAAGEDGTIYMFVETWNAFQTLSKVTDTLYRMNIDGYYATDNKFGFTCINNWDYINGVNYVRTTLSDINLSDAKGKIFSWDGKNIYKNTSDKKEYQFQMTYTNVPSSGDDTSTTKRIYFDNSLSKTPASDVETYLGFYFGNVYYKAWDSSNTSNSLTGKMTVCTSDNSLEVSEERLSNKYYVDIPKEYDRIIFGNSEDAVNARYNNSYTNASMTDVLDISGMATWSNPCFFANPVDGAGYANTSGSYDQYRGGVWADVNAVNVNGDSSRDIPQGTKTTTKDENTLYVQSTFYDYYSDYELSGNKRETITNVDISDYGYSGDYGLGYTNRRYMQARAFNIALSDYYSTIQAENPIYFGHFQWSGDSNAKYYDEIKNDLKLYGSDDYMFTTVGGVNTSNFLYNNNSTAYENVPSIGDTGARAAVQGLVDGGLSSEGLSINGVLAPYFNEAFIRGDNSLNTALGYVYNDIEFPFTYNEDTDKWTFDSADSSYTLRMTQDKTTGEYYLNNTKETVYGYSDDNKTANSNFFPFNDASESGQVDKLNYAFGLKLEIPFTLPDTDDKKLNGQDVKFEFSGDDDVWVFVDGQLVLDIGGGHGAVSGSINFTTGEVVVERVKNGSSYKENVVTTMPDYLYNSEYEHVITMFYMERGLWESNMKVEFNMHVVTSLDVEKQVDMSNVNSEIKSAISDNVDDIEFSFSIEGKTRGTKTVTKEVQVETNEVLNDCSSISTNNVLYYGNGQSSANTTLSTLNKDGRTGVIKCPYNNKGGDDNNYGITFYFDKAINLNDIDNLYFWVYNETTQTFGDISTLRITFLDESGDGFYAGGYNGFPADGSIGWDSTDIGKDYKNQWRKITLSASNFLNSQNSNFDETKVKAISIAYSVTTSVLYFDDISYYGQTTEEQEVSVPDDENYVNIDNMSEKEYTIDADTDNPIAVGTDGVFTLKNYQTAHFLNQFDEESIFKISESSTMTVNNSTKDVSDLFSTSWKLYRGTPEAMSRAVVEPSNTGTGLGPVTDGTDYDTAASATAGNSFTLKGYEETPDTVRFVNTMKTATLTVTKQLKNADGNDTTLDAAKTFTFEITLDNVGGINLEEDTSTTENETIVITKTITIETDGEAKSVEIGGIPVGTQYTIKETDGTDYDVTYTIGTGTITPGTNQTLSSDTTVTVTNKEKLQTGELILNKKITPDSDTYPLTDADKSAEFTFKVTLTSTSDLSTYTTIEQVDVKTSTGNNVTNMNNVTWADSGTAITWSKGTTDGTYTSTFTISIGSPIKITGLPSGTTYEVVETNVPTGYKTYTTEYTDTEKKIGNDTDDVVSIVNEKVGSLTVTKVDYDDNTIKISGAEFTLYVADTNGTETITVNGADIKVSVCGTVQPTNSDGIAKFSDLSYNTYYLKETKVPSGYQITDGSVKTITINDGNKNITETITNKALKMPETGGLGTDGDSFNYVLFGAGAIIIASIAFVILNKKLNLRGRKSSSSKEVQ